jgi:hypothetical protein
MGWLCLRATSGVNFLKKGMEMWISFGVTVRRVSWISGLMSWSLIYLSMKKEGTIDAVIVINNKHNQLTKSYSLHRVHIY